MVGGIVLFFSAALPSSVLPANCALKNTTCGMRNPDVGKRNSTRGLDALYRTLQMRRTKGSADFAAVESQRRAGWCRSNEREREGYEGIGWTRTRSFGL